MEIVKRQGEDALVLEVRGRIDGYWAHALRAALEEEVGNGAHRMRLDLSNVDFLSSPGISVLVQTYRQIKRLRGSFGIVHPSAAVSNALTLVGMKPLLVMDAPTRDGAAGSGSRAPVALDRLLERLEPDAAAEPVPDRRLEHGGAWYEVYPGAGGALTCQELGDPDKVAEGRVSEGDCRRVAISPRTFGLGIGALGTDFASCRDRLGEFLAVAGAIAYLPTDGSETTDYLAATRSGAPEVTVCQALVCEGQPSTLVRFEARAGSRRTGMSQIAEACLEIMDADRIGIVMIAEAAGLVGAARRRSPAAGVRATFQVPQVRDWLSFTAEPSFRGSLALVVGVVARGAAAGRDLHLTTLGDSSDGLAHLHAAVFSYRPLQQGVIELQPTVAALFESQELQSVLHLLGDDREIGGAGQSEFTRGACWLGPIAKTERETLE
jgi:anti-anti-sigma factor